MIFGRLLIAGLAANAALLGALALNAQADSDSNLICSGDQLVVTEWEFSVDPTSSLEGTEFDAAGILLSSPVIDADPDNIDLTAAEPVQGEDAAIIATSESGDLVALIQLEGSDDAGWRPATISRCLP